MILTMIVLFVEIIPLAILIVFCVHKFYGHKKNIHFSTILSRDLQNKKYYSTFVKEKSAEELRDLFTGNVKKHTITNTAKLHSSKFVLESYRMFLSKPQIMDIILKIREQKYDG